MISRIHNGRCRRNQARPSRLVRGLYWPRTVSFGSPAAHDSIHRVKIQLSRLRSRTFGGWFPCGTCRDGQVTRQALGGTLLLGLEILVAADLVGTIAVAPTLDNVLILGLIVLIRTFLSFSIDIEVSGTLPWRRGLATRASTIRQASASMPPTKRP